MRNRPTAMRTNQQQAGLTMVELLVALAIGSFLMIGAVQIYSQSRHAFVINESIARIQETAQFAMDTIEADLRMASNWGRNSRALAVEGRSLEGNVNPKGLPAPTTCGADWALDLALAVDGDNNAYTLPCGAIGGVQANSDVVTVRRVAVAASALEAGRLQIQSTRIQGELIANGIMPPTYTAADSSTHNLIVNSYYVAAQSNLIAGAPKLRRKSLTAIGGVPAIIDQEVAPGIENLQIQFGVDVDADNAVDRYVNPGDPVYDPAAVGYIPGARVISARIWLIVRGVTIETGITDLRDYKPGDINLGVYNDAYRRMQVSKTILMRNTRS